MRSPKDDLVQLFKQFPGIGTRQATRFVYNLLKRGKPYSDELVRSINRLQMITKLCPESFQYFETDDPSINTSPITRDPERSHAELLIIEKDTDIQPIERSGTYRGQYFVLGGLLSMIQSETTGDIRISQLLDRVERDASKQILNEIILGFSYTPESEHTRLYLITKLEPLIEKYRLTLTTLGRGLAMGSEIEYMDPDTIANAIQTRKSS